MSTSYYLFANKKTDAAILKEFGMEYELTDEPDLGYEVYLCRKSGGWDPLFRLHSGCPSVATLLDTLDGMPDSIQIMSEYCEFIPRDVFRRMVEEWKEDMDNGRNQHYHPKDTPDLVTKIDNNGFALTSRI